MNVLVRCAASAMALTFTAQTLPSSTAAAEIDAARAAAIDEVFTSRMAADGPGCVMGLIRGDRVLHWRGYGRADVEAGVPFTPRTPFATGSIYKQFYSAGVLELARGGRLSLDDDIRRYVPEIPDYGARITVRQLLDHTHGLREYGDLRPFAPLGTATDDPGLLRLLSRQQAPAAAPGARFRYGVTGPLVAGFVIARASGEPVGQFISRHVLDKAGMHDTSISDDTRPGAPRVPSYGRRPDGGLLRHPTGGRTRISIEDMARWNGRFESADPDEQAIMRPLITPARLRDGSLLDYGLGLRLNPYRGLARVWAPGGGVGNRAMFMRFPDAKVTIALGCNHDVNPITLAEAVADVVLADEIAGAAARVPPAAAVASSPAAAEGGAPIGTYVSETGRVLRIEVRGGRPHLLFEGTAHELVPSGPGRFTLPGRPDIPRDPVEEIAVFPRAAGTPARLEIRTNWYPARFTEVEPVALADVDLAEYVGEYGSEEMESVLRIVPREGRLHLEGPREAHLMTPVARDLFSAGPQTIRFERVDGRITRALVARGAVPRLPFVRRSVTTPGADARERSRTGPSAQQP